MGYMLNQSMITDIYGWSSYDHLVGAHSDDWRNDLGNEDTYVAFMLMDECGHMLFQGYMDRADLMSEKMNDPLRQHGSTLGAAYIEFLINGEWRVLDPEQRAEKMLRAYEEWAYGA